MCHNGLFGKCFPSYRGKCDCQVEIIRLDFREEVALL